MVGTGLSDLHFVSASPTTRAPVRAPAPQKKGWGGAGLNSEAHDPNRSTAWFTHSVGRMLFPRLEQTQ